MLAVLLTALFYCRISSSLLHTGEARPSDKGEDNHDNHTCCPKSLSLVTFHLKEELALRVDVGNVVLKGARGVPEGTTKTDNKLRENL
jgi:hypothetical protein